LLREPDLELLSEKTCPRSESECEFMCLLNSVVLYVRAHQGVENGQDVPAVLYHPGKNVSQLWLALRFFVPFSQNQGRHFDVASKSIRGMAAQEEAIEEGRFALRKVEVVDDFRRNELWQGRHREKCSLPKKFPPSSSTRGLLPPLMQLPVLTCETVRHRNG
jgi:hypothetical protein